LGHPFDNSDLELVRLFAEWVGNEIARQRDIEELAAAQEELKRLAGTDELTDVANRRQVELLAGHEVERARRQRADMAVFVLDADHFKRVNDDHGHEAGDQVLRVIAQLAKAQLRSVDVFGRLGGEEFVGVLPDTPADVAAEVADRIREAIAEEIIPVASDGLSITVSIGVAGLLSTDETFREVLNRADRALYAAKGAGRNRVIHHDHMNE
jgi:diguanylate cyclase (GGDEF)-like protein